MKNWLLSSSNKGRDGYIYNTVCGLLFSFQSVMILMVLTRTLGIEDAGVFTIAFAMANLMLNIGKYGMRNYQVTDAIPKYVFRQYLASRYITTAAMILASIAYVAFRSVTLRYSFDKTLIIVFMCLWKAIDAVEDVYYAQYQQVGRLDVAGKCMTIRMIATIVIYIGTILLIRNLLTATIVTTVLTFIVTAYVYMITVKDIIGGDQSVKGALMGKNNGTRDGGKGNLADRTGFDLLKETFPLFIAAFLSFYQINAPKYSIDALMSATDQANYGFIAMPIFVVGMLCQFIYTPLLNKLTAEYKGNQYKDYIRNILQQVLYIVLLTVAVIGGAYLLGIPVLSMLYGADLSALRGELCILMLGGGLYAFCMFMMTILTLQREQTLIIIGYVMASVLEFLAVSWAVKTYGLLGASWIFTAVMLIQAVYLSCALAVKLRKWMKGI